MRYSSSESNTFMRRYELPTCLLEVWTERSPLSDWQAQIVAQNLRFRLRLAQSQRDIKGNQQQITNLIEAVTTYCDRWLAQDDFETLDHTISVPKLSKLQLTTLQLFDLYESLELCANEFVILPNLVLEVRRLNPNWLKVAAGAIAIVGVSLGTIRLISPPFGEQPSFQIASTPAASSGDTAVTAPSASSGNKLETSEKSSKVAPSKPLSQNPNAATAPAAKLPSTSVQENRDAKGIDKMDKVAIAPEMQTPKPIGNLNSDRQRVAGNNPSMSDGITANSSQPSRRLDSPSKDASSATINAEIAKPSPSAPSAKIAVPSASRAANADIATTTSVKVIQIQSELPTDITNNLVRYIADQRITTSTTGILTLNLEISGDRISNLSVDMPSSTLQDSKSIAALEDLILKWRSPSSTAGKIRLVLQI